MPLYEYFCKPCGTQFELLRPVAKMDAPAVCPAGHTTNNRVVSMFATISKAATATAGSPAQGSSACCAGGCACRS